MVRLKDVDWMTGNGDTEYFNSTMVRLKEFVKSRYIQSPRFQFHYGTIKSNGRIRYGSPAHISIPLWYD